MKQYDYRKLIGRMKERGYTQATLAKKLGISECSLNFSLNNKRNFKQDEIMGTIDALDLPPSSIEEYFFAHKL